MSNSVRPSVPALDDSEAWFSQTSSLLDALNACAIVAVTDRQGRILYANEQFERISGYALHEVRGRDHRILNSGHHPRAFWKEMYRAVYAGETWRAEVKNRARDGSHYWVDTTVRGIFDEHGRLTRMIAIRIDISERKRVEEQLRENRERYRLAIRATNDGLWDWDLVHDRVYYSPRWRAMVGLDDKDATANQWLDRVHSDDLPQLRTDLQLCAAGMLKHLRNDHRMMVSGGSYRWMQARATCVHDDQGTPMRMVGSLSDIHELRTAIERLNTAASVDRLTDLPNRRLFMDRLNEAIRRASCFGNYRFAVLFLDFDRFKVFNDTLGHDAGDLLLREIASRMRRCLQATDSLCHETAGNTVARLGGDEFVAILDNVKSADDAMEVAERLRGVLEQPYHLQQHTVHTTASIGMVISDEGTASATDLLRDADAAMYEAKRRGKNCVVRFDASLRERYFDRLKLEEGLRHALTRDELFLVYQPIVSLETGRPTAVEALLRWRHPELGLITPAEFIPLAEESGLILPIGEWVIRHACLQSLQWRKERRTPHPPLISINLSPVQLALDDLPGRLAAIFDETGAPPGSIQFEVTESEVMRDPEASATLLRNIKQLGVALAMDDFGTGYSSLACLHQFPFDVLKIDRTFVANLNRGREFVALVHAVCTLADNLGMSTVAEGIEEADQIAVLQSLGCQYGQGYHFSKPICADAVPHFFAASAGS